VIRDLLLTWPSYLVGDIELLILVMASQGRIDDPTNEIPILEVESIQLVACHLGIHHVLINDKCRTLCIICDALPNLTGETE
jgi:hypothetical protein